MVMLSAAALSIKRTRLLRLVLFIECNQERKFTVRLEEERLHSYAGCSTRLFPNENIFKYYVIHAGFSPRKRCLTREDESINQKIPCHVIRFLTLCFVMDRCSRVIRRKIKFQSICLIRC